MTSMRSLSEYYNVHQKRGDVGIEIECEAKNPLPEMNEKNWRSVHDPSLRGNCMEYTTAQPIVLSAVEQTLSNLTNRINEYGILDSHRTSVHIHKNMLKYSPLQIWNGLCTYWIFEELLFSQCGKDRINNTFCLRLMDGEGVVESILYDLSLDFPFKSFKNNDSVRYSGANLAAIRKFGSVEFRGMRGTVDPNILLPWINNLSTMVDNAAVMFDSPEDLLDQYHDSKPENFLRKFFSPTFGDALLNCNAKWEESMRSGAERILPIAYAHDWKLWVEKQEKGFEDKVYKGTISPEQEQRDFHVPARARGGLNRNRVQWGWVEAAPQAGVPMQANVEFGLDDAPPMLDDVVPDNGMINWQNIINMRRR